MQHKHQPAKDEQAIVQRAYRAANCNEIMHCVFCGKDKKALYRVEYFDDLEYAMSRVIAGDDEASISNELWKRLVEEQEQGIYTRYATLYGCIACVSGHVSREIGNRNPVEIYNLFIHLYFCKASIILVRYTDAPYQPCVFYNDQSNKANMLVDFHATQNWSCLRLHDLCYKKLF